MALVLAVAVAVALSLALAEASPSTQQQQQRPVRLAFGVMTYQKPGQSALQTFNSFSRLMRVLYRPSPSPSPSPGPGSGPEADATAEAEHLYVLHVDSKSDTLLQELIAERFCRPKANCVTIAPRNVGWAGLTTGEMMLALMQTAVEFDAYKAASNGQTSRWSGRASGSPASGAAAAAATRADWDYFVLIGHESVPLVGLRYLEKYLSLYPRGTNFVNCWPVEGYDFFGQWEDNRYRLEQVVVEDFHGGLLEDGAVGGATRQPPAHIAFYKSIQLMVLSREFVEFACYGLNTRYIMLYLANVKTSDEMIIPTLLQSDPEFAATATCDTTLHFTHWIRPGGSWHPEYLTLEHLPKLLNTSLHLFARKFDNSLSKELLDVLTRIRTELWDDLDLERCCKRDPDGLDRNSSLYQSRGFLPVPVLQSEEVHRLDWVVPIALEYLRSLLASDTTDVRVKAAAIDDLDVYSQIKCLDLAQTCHDEPGTAVGSDNDCASVASACSDLPQITPLQVLLLLDHVRRARDQIEIDKFFEWLEQYQLYLEEQAQQRAAQTEPGAEPEAETQAESEPENEAEAEYLAQTDEDL